MGHPVREGLNLLDGAWYADDPHEIWTWMRREAPVYRDEASDVWGIARHADVLAIEKDPRTFSSRQAPRPHGHPLPMMISMDDPDHHRRRSRSEEHTSELQSLMRISYAVFCLKKKKT